MNLQIAEQILTESIDQSLELLDKTKAAGYVILREHQRRQALEWLLKQAGKEE